MQRGEDHIANFSRFQSQPDGLEVPHFANQDDIRVLSQRTPQCFVETQRIPVDFSLVHKAFLALVHKIDRIFDRQDELTTIIVDLVHHRRKHGALP